MFSTNRGALAASTAIALALLAAPAVAQAQVTYDFNLPAQPLADSLRDDGRTNAPIFFKTADGFQRAIAQSRNTFRGDVLFSYQPNPGTVFFAGYGSTLVEPDPLRFAQLRRTVDGLFFKVSYLFRV